MVIVGSGCPIMPSGNSIGIHITLRYTLYLTFLHAAVQRALKHRAGSCQHSFVKQKVLPSITDSEICKGGMQRSSSLAISEQGTGVIAAVTSWLRPDTVHLIRKLILVET